MEHTSFLALGESYEESASLTDQKLVLVAKDDPEKFGLLMERYSAALERYLVRLTGWGREEVQDILQEVFIKAYRYLNDYDMELKFSSWLYRIAHNQAIDTLRHHKAHATSTALPFEDVTRMIESDIDIEYDVTRQDELERVRDAIAELPDSYREALILRFLEEKSYEEIMDIMKKPKGTVATLVRRGRGMLMEKLQAR